VPVSEMVAAVAGVEKIATHKKIPKLFIKLLSLHQLAYQVRLFPDQIES
jgi:hypothetical protein